jgi:hypothetical protein
MVGVYEPRFDTDGHNFENGWVGKTQGVKKVAGTQPCNNAIEPDLRASYVW